MKKNNKGFMLAEVVVTSTLLLTIMVSLFFAFNRIYTRFNNITKYKNIDGMFAIENMIEYMINETGNNNINNILLSKENNNYKYIIDNKICKLSDNNYCNEIQKTYKINNLIIVNQTLDSINSLSVTNNTFKDYINYLKKYYPFDDYTKNSYLIIIEYKTNDDNNENNYNYSSLELR